jgi:hypothetical protein
MLSIVVKIIGAFAMHFFLLVGGDSRSLGVLRHSRRAARNRGYSHPRPGRRGLLDSVSRGPTNLAVIIGVFVFRG